MILLILSREEEDENATQSVSAPIHSHSLDCDADGEEDDGDVDDSSEDAYAEDEIPNASLFSNPERNREKSSVGASDDTITEDVNGNHINK